MSRGRTRLTIILLIALAFLAVLAFSRLLREPGETTSEVAPPQATPSAAVTSTTKPLRKPRPIIEKMKPTTSSRRLVARVRYSPERPSFEAPALVLYQEGAAPIAGQIKGREVHWRLPEDARGLWLVRLAVAIKSVWDGEKRRVFLSEKTRHPYVEWIGAAPSLDLSGPLPDPLILNLRPRVELTEVEIAVSCEGRPAPGVPITYVAHISRVADRVSGQKGCLPAVVSDEHGRARIAVPPCDQLHLVGRAEGKTLGLEGRYWGRAVVRWPPPALVNLELEKSYHPSEHPEYLHVRFRLVDEAGQLVKESARIELELVKASGAEGMGQHSARSYPGKRSLHFKGQPGTYRATIKTRTMKTIINVVLDQPGVLIEKEVVLQRLPKVEGRVVTVDGEPIEGAFVIVTSFENTAFAPPERSLAVIPRTDAEGRFSVLRRREDERWLKVFQRGYEQLSVDLTKARAPLVLTLRKGSEISGLILDSERRPLVTLDLTLRSGPFIHYERTDADGRFRFQGVPRGRNLLLEVERSPTSARLAVPIAHAENQRIVLPAVHRLELALRYKGRPFKGLARGRLVSIALDDPPPGVKRWRNLMPIIDVESGKSVIDGLAPGRYLLELSSRVIEKERSIGVLHALRLPSPPLELELEACARLRVSSQREGLVAVFPAVFEQALPRWAGVNVWWWMQSCETASIRRWRKGQALKPQQISDLPPGSYVVRWRAPSPPYKQGQARYVHRGELRSSQSIQLAPGESRSIDLP